MVTSTLRYSTVLSMVKLRTKLEKHANDNEKRRQSLKEREKTKLNQSQIIKQALSNAALHNSSKKTTFSDDDDDGDHESGSINNKNKNLNGNKSTLFDNSDSSDNEDFEIKEKTQFSGKKGFELLNLQSTYGNDKRFKIDERFLEDEKESAEEVEDNEGGDDGEKTKQLKILESVLGTPLKPEKDKKAKKRVYEMVRYDASNKEHEIYEINTPSATTKTPLKKRKESKKTSKTETENLNKPKVSNEKFYEVSSEIKNQLKNKENGQFSLLETYGGNENKIDEESDESEVEELRNSEEELNEGLDDYEMEIDVKEPKKESKKVNEKERNERELVARGIWKEKFFFDEDDERFKDALDFINKKDSSEATEAAENYEKTRKRLKEILRLHLKKQMHKKDPFKNKIGGMSKKQLASSKYRNSKTNFSKRNSSRTWCTQL